MGPMRRLMGREREEEMGVSSLSWVKITDVLNVLVIEFTAEAFVHEVMDGIRNREMPSWASRGRTPDRCSTILRRFFSKTTAISASSIRSRARSMTPSTTAWRPRSRTGETPELGEAGAFRQKIITAPA